MWKFHVFQYMYKLGGGGGRGGYVGQLVLYGSQKSKKIYGVNNLGNFRFGGVKNREKNCRKNVQKTHF